MGHTSEFEKLKQRIQFYLDQGALEEAFVGLWLMLQDKSMMVQCEQDSLLGVPIYEAISAEIYEEEDWVADLANTQNFTYKDRTLAEYLNCNPLEVLWLLDFYLYTRCRPSSNFTQTVTFQYTNHHSQTVYLIPRDPAKTLARSCHDQVTDKWKCYPCHTVFPAVIGGMAVHIDFLKPTAKIAFKKLKRVEEIKIYVDDLDDDVYPIWRDGVARRLSNLSRRKKVVLSHLQTAARQGYHMVVFPELSINNSVRKEIAAWLRKNKGKHSIAWVVAGSFHERMTKDKRQWINRSYSYSHGGGLMHWHTKYSRFGKLCGEVENIKEWTDIWILNTPLGLAGTPICLDFCQSNPFAEVDGRLVDCLTLELCFVPAMVDSDSAFRDKAKNLHRFRGTRSAVAIQRPPVAPGEKDTIKESLSFVYP